MDTGAIWDISERKNAMHERRILYNNSLYNNDSVYDNNDVRQIEEPWRRDRYSGRTCLLKAGKLSFGSVSDGL